MRTIWSSGFSGATGTVTTSWGEVTGAYYDNSEAERLWGPERPGAARGYIEPDACTATAAWDMAARKLGKYRDLAERRGRGHLLVLLHSPLTDPQHAGRGRRGGYWTC